MKSIRDQICALPSYIFSSGTLRITPIQDDDDLWYATVECRLAPGQDAFVNPAGFSIGRAYLHPEDNLPCIIWNGESRIGYIVLRKWIGDSATSWSYYLDKDQQGKGFGKAAALLAVRILKSAFPDQPIKLSAEKDNVKAHRLYRSAGFALSDETDGDDLVFLFK